MSTEQAGHRLQPLSYATDQIYPRPLKTSQPSRPSELSRRTTPQHSHLPQSLQVFSFKLPTTDSDNAPGVGTPSNPEAGPRTFAAASHTSPLGNAPLATLPVPIRPAMPPVQSPTSAGAPSRTSAELESISRMFSAAPTPGRASETALPVASSQSSVTKLPQNHNVPVVAQTSTSVPPMACKSDRGPAIAPPQGCHATMPATVHPSRSIAQPAAASGGNAPDTSEGEAQGLESRREEDVDERKFLLNYLLLRLLMSALGEGESRPTPERDSEAATRATARESALAPELDNITRRVSAREPAPAPALRSNGARVEPEREFGPEIERARALRQQLNVQRPAQALVAVGRQEPKRAHEPDSEVAQMTARRFAPGVLVGYAPTLPDMLGLALLLAIGMFVWSSIINGVAISISVDYVPPATRLPRSYA